MSACHPSIDAEGSSEFGEREEHMRKVIVCGSTGTQGGAVFAAMKDSEEIELTGFTRDLSQARVAYLRSQGLSMLEGDLADLDSLQRAFEGADGVFGLTQPWNKAYTKVDTDLERKQGTNIVKACLANGIKHLVFSSAAHGEDERTGLPHVDVKIDIEEAVKSSGLGYTFLNPVQFMDNVGLKFLPVKKGRIRGFIHGDAKVPYVAARDIGLMAGRAFEEPKRFDGQVIVLVGDVVSGVEIAEILGRIRSERFRYRDVPKFVIRLVSKEFYKMRLAFEESGTDEATVREFQEAMETCRKLNPKMLSMEDYLKMAGWHSRKL
jgi:uncharacterized protein YbjT (DUF2867 family)